MQEDSLLGERGGDLSIQIVQRIPDLDLPCSLLIEQGGPDRKCGQE